ncbi:MAG TPA: helix-turn-helix transcriptional regulator [Thermomicrobiales bacterium]|nr:helix-turn-helix transcriptional regulator [Thermomicrobiales bacterium]
MERGTQGGPTTPAVAVGRALRTAREARGLSQEQLALASGYSRYYVGLLEQGRRNATVLALFRLGRVLELAPSELLRRAEALVTHIPDRDTGEGEEAG